MQSGNPHHEMMICNLCSEPLTLLPIDTTTDENGKSVHPACYFDRLTRRKPVSPSVAD